MDDRLWVYVTVKRPYRISPIRLDSLSYTLLTDVPKETLKKTPVYIMIVHVTNTGDY